MAGGRGAACDSPICYKMEHFSFTAFLMSKEPSRSEAVCVCSELLCVSSLYSAVFRIKRSSLQSYSPHVVWVSGPGLPAFEDYRENQGRDTVVVVLTLRHGLLNCWVGKMEAEHSLFCSGELTLLNKDSAGTHRLLRFLITGCSSSFSTPTKAAASKQLQRLFPLLIPSRMSAVPLSPALQQIQGP